MRRFTLLFIVLLTASSVIAQSRYIPLGVNGTSFSVSSRFNSNIVKDVIFEAGYAIGGRMDFSLEGGALFEYIDGSTETIPGFSFNYDIVMLKQQKAVPFSVRAGMGLGFVSALPEGKTIFGTSYGFNMMITHDIRIKRVLLGFNGIFEYNRHRFEVRDPPDAEPPTLVRLHQFLYGVGIDIGYSYYEDNLIVLRFDVLWDRNAQIWGRCNLFLIVPTMK